MAVSKADPFLADVPVLPEFSEIVAAERAAPVPNDWYLGLSDVVNSTRAVEAGRYKTVNVAGAAVIAALANTLPGRDIPFIFGGDGASFAVPAADAEAAREILAATAALVRDTLDLELRTALVPVTAIRAAGLDLKLAFFAASKDVRYAMFSGGGLAWAERRMKAGDFAVPPAPVGTYPDLTGLSCRFEPMQSRHGLILSIIVRAAPDANPARYRELINDVLQLAESGPDRARPVPEAGPGLRWPWRGVDIEARLSGETGSLRLRRLALLLRSAFIHLVFRFSLRPGGFDPKAYLGQLVGNSDYRKYDDGLRMTIDCPAALADRIEAVLDAAREAGIVVHGLHRQDAALLTCFTPAAHRRDHVHFVDGAAGGYAAAAAQLKERLDPVGLPPGEPSRQEAIG